MLDLILHLYLLPVALFCALYGWYFRKQSKRVWLSLGLFILMMPVGGVLLIKGAGIGTFGAMRMFCWGLFLYFPVLLSISGSFLRQHRFLAAAFIFATIGTDAFIVEPKWLEVRHHAIEGLPVRIVLITDLQTDQMGDYETHVLEEVVAAKPELILFAGDYIQLTGEAFNQQAPLLNAALKTMMQNAAPRLGAFAVRGDVDPDDWRDSFSGTGIQVVGESEEIELLGIHLTALSPQDSRAPKLNLPNPVRPATNYHIVLGHAPDIALMDPDADLIVAGHTHGGQVQLPFFGPLFTSSDVPRVWAAGGMFDIGRATLVVSRGIGMERREAPRLRFLCRPELVILDPA